MIQIFYSFIKGENGYLCYFSYNKYEKYAKTQSSFVENIIQEQENNNRWDPMSIYTSYRIDILSTLALKLALCLYLFSVLFQPLIVGIYILCVLRISVDFFGIIFQSHSPFKSYEGVVETSLIKCLNVQMVYIQHEVDHYIMIFYFCLPKNDFSYILTIMHLCCVRDTSNYIFNLYACIMTQYFEKPSLDMVNFYEPLS